MKRLRMDSAFSGAGGSGAEEKEDADVSHTGERMGKMCCSTNCEGCGGISKCPWDSGLKTKRETTEGMLSLGRKDKSRLGQDA